MEDDLRGLRVSINARDRRANPLAIVACFSLLGLGTCGTSASTGPSANGSTTTGPTGPTIPAAAILFQENFEDGAYAARGWYDTPPTPFPTTTTAEHAPGSTRALEVRFAPGGTNPSPRVSGRHAFPETESLYFAYWVKYSENWTGSGKPYHPHEFHFLTNADVAYVGPANTFLTVDVEHNYGANGGVTALGIQDSRNIDTTKINQDLTNVTERRAVAGCNGSFDNTPSDCYRAGAVYLNGKVWKSTDVVFAPTPGPSYKSNWHRVEVFLQLNSIANGKGQSDGLAQMWVDGRQVIDRR